MESKVWRWIAFAAGTLALFFSNGVHGNVVGAWLAPALLLVFVVNAGVWVGFVTVIVASSAASFFMWRGAIPIADSEYVILSIISGVFVGLPFLLHRISAQRLGALAGSLVYPSAATALGYLSSLGSPFGTWGNEAYMQMDIAPLAQLASVLGIWGVAFMVSWAASTIAILVQARNRNTFVAASVFFVCLIAVLGFGASRLVVSQDVDLTVRAAALNNPSDLPDRFFEGCERRDDYACRTASARARWERLFDMSAVEARNGARVIVWYEAAAQYDESDEPEFVARAQAFAQEHNVYLIAGAARIPNGQDALIENKALVFTPDGELAFEYLKSVPVPGEPIVPGDREIRTLETPFGRLGVIICFDADFPDLSRQAAARGVDVLAIPANDWRAITPLHGEMVRLRAIENGFSIVRASSNGLSLIANQQGVVLASVNSFDEQGVATVANVPSRLQPTFYGEIDDQFAGVTALMLLGLLLAALGRWVREALARQSKSSRQA